MAGDRLDTSMEERAFFAAQAKTEKHKAREAELRANKAQIEFNRLDDEDRWMRATNPFHQVYAFDTQVDERSVGMCVAQLDIWHRLGPKKEMTLQFYSPGGDVLAGMYLFDRLRDMHAQGHKIVTEAYGMAASMAGILLQAGDVRRMGREAYILIHQVSFSVRGSFGAVEDELKFVTKIQDRIVNIFVENMAKAKARNTASKPLDKKTFIKNWARKDWWLSSDEALKHGLIDEVI